MVKYAGRLGSQVDLSSEVAASIVTGAKTSTAVRTKTALIRLGSVGATNDHYLLVAPSAGTVTQASIVSDVASDDSATATTNWSFQVRNLTQSDNLLATALTSTATAIAADTVYDLGPDQNLTLAANDVLELQIVKAGTPAGNTLTEVSAQLEFTVSA